MLHTSDVNTSLFITFAHCQNIEIRTADERICQNCQLTLFRQCQQLSKCQIGAQILARSSSMFMNQSIFMFF